MSTLEIEIGDLLARAVDVTATELVVTLRDGRRIATPLAWYPRLLAATPSSVPMSRSCRWACTGRTLMKI